MWIRGYDGERDEMRERSDVALRTRGRGTMSRIGDRERGRRDATPATASTSRAPPRPHGNHSTDGPDHIRISPPHQTGRGSRLSVITHPRTNERAIVPGSRRPLPYQGAGQGARRARRILGEGMGGSRHDVDNYHDAESAGPVQAPPITHDRMAHLVNQVLAVIPNMSPDHAAQELRLFFTIDSRAGAFHALVTSALERPYPANTPA